MLIKLLLAVLAITGLWLVGPARLRMDEWTATLVFLHLGAAMLAAPVFIGSGFRSRKRGARGSRSGPFRATFGLLCLTFFTGLGLIATAARGHAAPEALYWCFLAAGGSAAVTGLLLYWPGSVSARGPGRCGSPAARAAGVVVVLLLMFVAGSAATSRQPVLPREYDPEEYYSWLTATNAAQAGNFHFPAGTRWTDAQVETAPSAAYCGTAGCHPGVHREWLGSPHAMAATTALYGRAVDQFRRERGEAAARWCAGCHSPADLLDAAARLHSGGQRGVDCVACHAIGRVSDLAGNGRMELRIPSDYRFATHRDARLRWLHGFLLRLRPEPHRHAYLQPALHRRSEACAPCHRTGYNLPQNQYKFLRTSDDYGSWQAGFFSGEAVHGFYPPGPARQCQDCHSAHSGKLEHGTGPRAFEGADSKPVAPPPITVDILALRRRPTPDAAAEELAAPLERAARLKRGEAVTIDVVVSNRGVGHQFPAGTGDLTGAWLEVQVLDTGGRTLLQSGSPSTPTPARSSSARHQAAPPEAGAHYYGLIALDRHGRRLVNGDLWQMATPLFHRTILPGQPDADRRTIQPGESDVVRYRLQIPKGVRSRVELRAQLWYGSLVHGLISGGHPQTGRRSLTPRLVAEDRVTLTVPDTRTAAGRAAAAGVQDTATGDSSPVAASPALSERFYDYGVGLLLQGDLSRAQRAMRSVQAWAPADWRGYFGLGRVYLTEGDLLAARAQFERAAQFAPSDPRPRAFLATTVRKSGQYEEAIALLLPLVGQYPRDRMLWFDLGMSYYLSGSYEEAARSFEAILAVDPDDLAAHFNRMRCLRRLRRIPEARQEEVIYEALREDDAAKRIGLSFLEQHPWAERETRTIHEHELLPDGAVRSSQRTGP
jgi:Flp pilus assembly protein TadD